MRNARLTRATTIDIGVDVRQHDELVSDLFRFLRKTKSVVFVNPVAGAGRAERNLRRVRLVFDQMETNTEFVIAENATDTEARVRDAVRGGARLLFAMGGDGTVQAVVNAICAERTPESEIALGILPSGGGNDFAAALRLPKDPVKAVTALPKMTLRWVDALRARTGDGKSRLFLGGGGVGLDVDAVRLASSTYRKWPGRSRYLASALHAWRSFEPIGVRVEFPDDNLPAIEECVMLAAALNTPSYGAGLRIAPEAKIDDGLMNVSILKNMTAAQVARAIPRLCVSGNLPESYFIRKKARTLILQTDRVCEFHGDGEILGTTPVRIEVASKAIQVFAMT